MASLGLDHFVHTAGSEGSFDHVGNGSAGINIRNDLVDSLGVVSSVFQKDDLWLEHI